MSVAAATAAPLDEYLGADGEGREYYTRGGQVYAAAPSAQSSPEHTRAPCPRGRLSAFNRLRRRRPGTVAA